jgi:hypothetical protein
VPGQRFDRFGDEPGRQLVETDPNDVYAGTDIDQRDFGTLARSDLDRGVKRDCVPDDFAPFGGDTLVLQECIAAAFRQPSLAAKR